MTTNHAPPKFMTQEEASRLFGGSYDAQCARCGSSMDWVDCDACGGEGVVETVDDLDDERMENCHQCDGEGSWPVCLSSYEWCAANPLPGREAMSRNTVEWFQVPEVDLSSAFTDEMGKTL